MGFHFNRNISTLFTAFVFCAAAWPLKVVAQPTINLPNLSVRTVVDRLSSPTAIAFIGRDEFLVAEKNTGIIKRVRNGAVQGVALDLAVNFASERGLLGMALHPNFPANPGVYLFWTCIATNDAPAWAPGQPPPAFIQSQTTCSPANMFGSDTDQILRVPVLGNRVDRFRWNAANNTLVFDQNLISLRSFQNDGIAPPANQGDEGQPPRGNHDGGVLRFGQDGRLYIFFGDQGRRGELQNLAAGPTPPFDDDQFGGAEPDNDHLAGVILRLNPDGSTPPDNPFFLEGTGRGGNAGLNLQKIWAYGLRNSFGMTVEPRTGDVWITEHGDDTFDEINRITRGMNGGWVQVAGPIERIPQFRSIETTFFLPPEPFPSLQQWRYPPSRIANSPGEARSRMVQYRGSQYSDPEFSWKWATLPVALCFIEGKNLGPQFEGDLFVNLVGNPMGPGYLIRFHTVAGQTRLAFDDPRLQDRVADNSAKFDITESDSLIIGSGYGISTDMQMSPRGTLYVVSFSNGAVYEIFGRNRGGDDDDNDDDDDDDDDNDRGNGRNKNKD